jgi:hypothetical protein
LGNIASNGDSKTWETMSAWPALILNAALNVRGASKQRHLEIGGASCSPDEGQQQQHDCLDGSTVVEQLQVAHEQCGMAGRAAKRKQQ